MLSFTSPSGKRPAGAKPVGVEDRGVERTDEHDRGASKLKLRGHATILRIGAARGGKEPRN